MMGLLLTAWLDVRSKPLRTIAATAGMIAAIIAVVVVDAAGILSNRANEEYLQATYGRPATMNVSVNLDTAIPTDQFNEELARFESYLQRNGITRVSLVMDTPLQIVKDGQMLSVSTVWVSPEIEEVGVIRLIAGSFPHTTATAPVLHSVVTAEFLRALGIDPMAAVGATLEYVPPGAYLQGEVNLQTQPAYTIVIDGVVESFGPGFESNQLMLVTERVSPHFGSIQNMQWMMHIAPDDVTYLNELISEAQPFPHVVEPYFRVFRVDQGESLQPVLEQQEVTARAVQAVALIIGGLGILGVGLSSVRERSQEFGLRRALGASKKRVFADVLVQTLIEVILAASIATPIAAIVVDLFARQLVLESLPLPRSTALPLESALLGITAALIVGLVAGILPAVRAARASVVQSLRG